MRLEYETLQFKEEKGKIKVTLLNLFHFHIEKEGISKVRKHSIEVKSEKRFNTLLSNGFKSLKSSLTKKPAIYIHQNSGIPLIGNIAFGLVDRNTNIIEVKPITGCNLDCIYCSVSECLRSTDFVVEKDYLISEFRKLAKFKQSDSKCKGIEAHIGTHGEPLLYADIIPLIADLAGTKGVKTISMDTNGVMLSEKLIDRLTEAGLTRFNLSINAIDPKTAKKIAGKPYDIAHIKKMAKYISKKCNLLIAPVIIPKINEQEMPKIVEFAKSIGAKIGIQNFLNYRYGKNPSKAWEWDDFYKILKDLEKKERTSLILKAEDFGIHKTPQLPKPFKKGEKIKARIACKGRMDGEMIAVAKDRTITAINCQRTGEVKLKITRDKHNIFYGSC